MMKKSVLALLLAVVSLSANAQFDKGTYYLNTSLTGLSMSYSKDSKFHLGFEATGGYFIDDCWMPYGRLGFNHQAENGPDRNSFELGAGTRYYFKRTGIYLSGGLLYEFVSRPLVNVITNNTVVYVDKDNPSVPLYIDNNIISQKVRERNNNISIALEAGYCFYVNHYLSIEPAVFYNLCLNDFSDGSKVGLKIGLGFYF